LRSFVLFSCRDVVVDYVNQVLGEVLARILRPIAVVFPSASAVPNTVGDVIGMDGKDFR
jgi:hypothetical protein